MNEEQIADLSRELERWKGMAADASAERLQLKRMYEAVSRSLDEARSRQREAERVLSLYTDPQVVAAREAERAALIRDMRRIIEAPSEMHEENELLRAQLARQQQAVTQLDIVRRALEMASMAYRSMVSAHVKDEDLRRLELARCDGFDALARAEE